MSQLGAVDLLAASKLTWYTSRASGVVLWALSAISVIWGLLLAHRGPKPRGRAAWILDLHRYLGTLSIVFLVIHLAALRMDRFQPFYAGDLFLPMHSEWKPEAVAWGIVSMFLLLAVQITSFFRTRMSKRLWHSLHLLSFPMLLAGSVHAFTAGTDTASEIIRYSSIGTGVVLSGVLALRIASIRYRRRKHATPGGPARQTVRDFSIPTPQASPQSMG